MKKLAVLFLFLSTLSVSACAGDTAQEKITYTTDMLTIQTKKKPVNLSVEVAMTPEQIQHGLMFRESLPERHGMIFLFHKPQAVEFWMKNTPLPLDILFVDAKGRITDIVANTKPMSLDHIPSGGNVLGVIELAAGSAKRLHIAKGDKVLYSWFHE